MGGDVILAISLTILAGLATGLGALIAFFTKKTNKKVLSLALGFSAGVMIYVSLVEIFVEAKDSLTVALGDGKGYWITVISFFAGMILIALIDKFIPQKDNPHEVKTVEDVQAANTEGLPMIEEQSLLKIGILSSIAITIHNFPEGIATFMSTIQDPHVGFAIAIAVAIHNIPEGIAVAVPIYFATGNRRKAFRLSFLSGLSEPLGAILAFLVLLPFLNDLMFGIIFAAVAGIMVFISLDELLPAAKKYDEAQLSIYGLMGGMFIMAVSLILLA